ncbi:1-deoxy-D-xylulose-5-phosphate synthase [Faecalicoccus acidiformans]|uniref:1-deoxy-D-xylulose-5-phosphate synthase n=1 Tax=Faecalicoccus acidiformans TaxID=915173 RepID=A0ABS2FLQ0_9FIRM|nr:1-deoxy-D-xylulose-5-phosphate synthase [Faecalicoccus acidiformans]MBM6830906.1 1-deoxy-D-xylulose-5-phosphate synthase [Faecalicoccus acidiformans]MDM8203902.1 1-deoxy-D-xylulose-5-phosphate synthase [Faecalicoccus acidiformans]
MQIYDIKDPSQIKNLSMKQLDVLAQDIRHFLIQNISKTGGHLSSNLGIVEITIAMHYVFSSPKDKMIFDVGHQSYVHKILTGRSTKFATLRKLNGLSGYQKRSESPHDCWEAGHSSTSLSAALGYAIARDVQHQNYEVIAVIGDGALAGGMSLEALNDIGAQKRKMIIIFNDNAMSISKNRGGVEKRITSIRSSHLYRSMKNDIKVTLPHNKMGDETLKVFSSIRDRIKSGLIDAPLFQEFNLDYLGPVDGHNIPALIKVFEAAKEHDGPIVVHVRTKKGKGYRYAEQDKIGQWHGVSPFNIQTGQPLMKLPINEKTWSNIISDGLIELAKKNKDVVAITPAMAQGSKLLKFAKLFPDRFFDCGIAEEHAITMAGAMSLGGLRPFVSIYSSFLQRAYDQMNHDLGRMDLPVVIGIDRAGLVGDDGETHQGVFDISFLRSIPNLILSQPKDAKEAYDLLYTAFATKHPFCIRYPRGQTAVTDKIDFHLISIGSWERFDIGSDPKAIIISYGPDVDRIIHTIHENNLSMIVVNARFFKPIDQEMCKELFNLDLPIYVYETDVKIGGLSSAVLEYQNEIENHIHILGIDDHYVQHGSIRSLRKKEHIDLESLFREIERYGQD